MAACAGFSRAGEENDNAVGQAATAWHERFLEASRAHHLAFLAPLPADVVARALAAMGQSRPAA